MSQQISQKEAQEAFNKEVENQLAKWQNETMFDKALLPKNFGDLVSEVFMYNSPFNLRMAVDYYKAIIENKSNVYTLMEISCICHAAKLRNAHELGMEMTEYVNFQEGIENIAREYLTIVAKQKETIERKMMATIRAEKSVPDDHKTIKFPIPTAQA